MRRGMHVYMVGRIKWREREREDELQYQRLARRSGKLG